MITNIGLQDILDQLATDFAQERVLVSTLRKSTDKVKRQFAQQLQDDVLQIAWPYPEQAYIANYLNTLPYSIFQAEDDHFHDAYEIAKQLDNTIVERDPQSLHKHHHKNTVSSVYGMWKPFYAPLTNEDTKTPRIFGTELTFMKSTVRHALYPNWIDFDLKNCHLAIIAYLFDAPRTKEFLASGSSFWQVIMDYMHVEPEKRERAKEFLKPALYSIVYGMAKTQAQATLEQKLASNGIWWSKDFTKHPIVQEIAKVVYDAKKSIKENKGMESAYGWIELGEEDKIESILSCVVQSYELAIIASCYKLVKREKTARNNDFDIVLHQHDGFSIAPKKGANLIAIERKLKKVVTAHACNYGVSMEIEMKKG